MRALQVPETAFLQESWEDAAWARARLGRRGELGRSWFRAPAPGRCQWTFLRRPPLRHLPVLSGIVPGLPARAHARRQEPAPPRLLHH